MPSRPQSRGLQRAQKAKDAFAALKVLRNCDKDIADKEQKQNEGVQKLKREFKEEE